MHIQLDQDMLAAFCRRNHIVGLSLFGSVLREDFGPESDVDMLVEFNAGAVVAYFDMARMEEDLAGMVGRKVDLRTPQELSRNLWDKVLTSALVQYAA